MSQAWQHHPPPAGWQGQWPPPPGMQMPPGFPGPPPVPQGVPIPPQAWQSGFWQYNPASRNQAMQGGLRSVPPQGAGPWAPSNQWGRPMAPPGPGSQPQQSQQQQVGEGFNPYKKVPKPPEAGYYDFKLSDNPLGLEGMVPRKEPAEGEEPKTPWIWNPATLRETDERPIKATSFPHSRTSSSREGGSSSASRHQALYQQQQQQQGSQSRSTSASVSAAAGRLPQRSASVDLRTHNPGVIAPTLGYYGVAPGEKPDMSRHRALTQNPVFPSDPSSNGMPAGFVPNSSSSASSPIPPPPPAGYPPRSQTQPPPQTNNQSLRKTESFTERKELHPTFSPQIVRTPDHYHKKNFETTRQQQHQSARSPNGSNIYKPSTSSGLSSSYTPRDDRNGRSGSGSTSVSRSNSREDGRQAQPLERHSSLPANLMSSSSSSARSPNSITGLASFSEEPSSLLSPLIGATPKPRTGNLGPASGSSTGSSLSRSKTLATISESTTSSPRPSPRERDRDRERDRERERAERDRDRERTRYSSRDREPERPPTRARESERPSTRDRESERPSTREREKERPSTRDRDRERSGSLVAMSSVDGTPSRSRTASSTPHPRRENPLPAPPTASHREVPMSPQRPAPASYSRKLRKGLWNKRGDHLTSDMHVVYAPANRTYPKELENYPDGRDGYWDAVMKQHVPWLEDRPELPSSLPHRGRPPTQPYDTFVVYTYLP